MTTLVEHGATVLPFPDALLRRPRKRPLRAEEPPDASPAELPDNVILLAGFTRRAARSNRLAWRGDHPGGDAA